MSDETFRWVVASGVGIAALSIFLMALGMIVLFRIVTRVQRRVDSIAENANPLVDSVRHLINDNGPKIGDIVTSAHEAAANVRDISIIAKDQAHRFAEVGRDITDRAKVQVARVDAAVDDTVEQVQHLGSNMKAAVAKPVTEAAGIIAGFRAAVSTYAQGRRPNVARATQDEEMFI